MSIDPGTLRELAGQAGHETGECYPSSGRWLLRFVELVEDHLRREQPLTGALPEQIQEALQFYGRRENWQRDVVPHPGRRAEGVARRQAEEKRRREEVAAREAAMTPEQKAKRRKAQTTMAVLSRFMAKRPSRLTGWAPGGQKGQRHDSRGELDAVETR